jgi:hypothetical protein
VEGEVNGLYTYDRRVLRPNAKQWKEDIQSLYEAANGRGGAKTKELRRSESKRSKEERRLDLKREV